MSEATHIVVCEQDGCENAGVPIEVPAVSYLDGTPYPVTMVICGPCGTVIPIPGGDDGDLG